MLLTPDDYGYAVGPRLGLPPAGAWAPPSEGATPAAAAGQAAGRDTDSNSKHLVRGSSAKQLNPHHNREQQQNSGPRGRIRNNAVDAAHSLRPGDAQSPLPSPSRAARPHRGSSSGALGVAAAGGPLPVCCLAVSPSGRQLAFALSDGSLHLALLHASAAAGGSGHANRAVCVRLLQPTAAALAAAGHPCPGVAVQLAFTAGGRRLLALALAPVAEAEAEGQDGGGGSGSGRAVAPAIGRVSDGGGRQRAPAAREDHQGSQRGGVGGSGGGVAARYVLHAFPLTHEEAGEAAEDGQGKDDDEEEGGEDSRDSESEDEEDDDEEEEEMETKGMGGGGVRSAGSAGGRCRDVCIGWLPVPPASSRGPMWVAMGRGGAGRDAGREQKCMNKGEASYGI